MSVLNAGYGRAPPAIFLRLLASMLLYASTLKRDQLPWNPPRKRPEQGQQIRWCYRQSTTRSVKVKRPAAAVVVVRVDQRCARAVRVRLLLFVFLPFCNLYANFVITPPPPPSPLSRSDQRCCDHHYFPPSPKLPQDYSETSTLLVHPF